LGQNSALGRFKSALIKILRERRDSSAMAALYKKHLGRVLESLSRRRPIRKPAQKSLSFPPTGSQSIAPPVLTAANWKRKAS
jgi:hypothetical protein